MHWIRLVRPASFRETIIWQQRNGHRYEPWGTPKDLQIVGFENRHEPCHRYLTTTNKDGSSIGAVYKMKKKYNMNKREKGLIDRLMIDR